MTVCTFQPFRDVGPISNVYVYRMRGGWCCCTCRIGLRTGNWNPVFAPAEMISHLREHVAEGHQVPALALETGSYV